MTQLLPSIPNTKSLSLLGVLFSHYLLALHFRLTPQNSPSNTELHSSSKQSLSGASFLPATSGPQALHLLGISAFSFIHKQDSSRCSIQFSCSVVSDSATPWTAASQTFLSITNTWSLLKLISVESVMPSNHLILCHPLLLPPSIFSSIRIFFNEFALYIKWPKYWSFSFSISPSNEYSGLISFRMDLLDLLAVQGTLKSILQHHRSKASILQCSAFFIVQISHPYMTIGNAGEDVEKREPSYTVGGNAN